MSHTTHIRLLAATGLGILLLFAVGRTARGQEIKIDNTARYASEGRYDWTVFIVAEDSVLNNIDHVVYTLHPTFSDPRRSVSDRGRRCAFALSSTAWGEFNIGVKVVFKNKAEYTTDYHLNLFDKSKGGADPCKETSNRSTPRVKSTKRRRG
jgi:transcription initiation factor IIF auxiliary subunit